MRRPAIPYTLAIAALGCLATWLWIPVLVSAQTNVAVAFTTTNATPLNLGFAGFTTELLSSGTEYGDTNMQQLAAVLSPGWLPTDTIGCARFTLSMKTR